MKRWLLNPPSGSSGQSCFGMQTLDVLISALCVGLPPNPGLTPTPDSWPGSQEAAWFSHYFQPDSFWKVRRTADPALNTPEPAFCPSPTDPGKPTLAHLISDPASFFLLLGVRTRTPRAAECHLHARPCVLNIGLC